MQVRLIHFATENLELEEITFTEDFEANVNDFRSVSGIKLVTDKIIEADLPDSFPLDHSFIKK